MLRYLYSLLLSLVLNKIPNREEDLTMILNKFKIKYIIKILFGLNILCIISFFLIRYFNVVAISSANIFMLILFLYFFTKEFSKRKKHYSNATIYFCSIAFIGELFYIGQVFFELGRRIYNQ